MNNRLISTIFLITLGCFSFNGRGTAQKPAQTLSVEEIKRYKEEAVQLVSYLQFTFNTLGNAEVSTKEKDIIINQSWAKIFENDKVQIEDDLDENRDVLLNKDVQAYLKDIDFFFREVTFTFSVQEVEQQVNDKNQVYFKVTMNRNLKGTTIDGKKIDSNRLRYVEINLNDDNKELKVASIYTTKLNEREELRRWWNELPTAWRTLLGENITIMDTLKMKHVLWYNDSIAGLDVVIQRRITQGEFSFNEMDTLKIRLSDTIQISAGLIDRQIQKIILLDTINISGKKEIVSIEPVSKLTKIKRLDISNTSVDDLMPARNLSNLEHLNASGTLISQLDAIRYLTKLQHLDISKTRVADVAPLANFTSLIRVNLSKTAVSDLDPLKGLQNLKGLDISGTQVRTLNSITTLTSLDRLDFSETSISDISPLGSLTKIVFLKFEQTSIANLDPLRNMTSLNLLFVDQTPVSDLSPLNGLPNLSRIYCDQTRVTRQEATRFTEQNPNVLVIYETAELIHWWSDLPQEWKSVFAKQVSNSAKPTKEELHDVTRTRQLNLADNQAISALEPVANMPMLAELFIQGTSVTDLSPLSKLTDLRELNFSNTQVNDLSPLENLIKLNRLSFDSTPVTTIAPIMQHNELNVIYCDYTPVNVNEIIEFMLLHPSCLVVYQTDELREWWAGLPEVWKALAEKYITPASELSREQLQELVNIRVANLDASTMSGRSLEITSLEYLRKMIMLEELRFSNTRVTSLAPLSGLKRLHTLICTNNPIVSLQPLSEITSLEVIDIQNTPIKQLTLLAPLKNLRKLNCSGTQIKNLKGLEHLKNLEQLDCFNTRITNLKHIQDLPNLKLVRCYNTRITQRTISKFQSLRPDVEVVFY